MSSIDPSKLVRVMFDSTSPFSKLVIAEHVFVDRQNGVVVQIWESKTPGCDGTPWEGTLRVAVKHTAAKNPTEFADRKFSKPITWDDLQAIKDRFWPSRIAVEVFPPKDKIVDAADMRWLWVLPPGAVLPFNLQANSSSRLASDKEEAVQNDTTRG